MTDEEAIVHLENGWVGPRFQAAKEKGIDALRERIECENPKWKEIVGFNGKYEVSNMGDVRIKKSGYILAKSINRYGYYCVWLIDNGNRKNRPIHRLVAETFIANPLSLPEVNHKDENKKNNAVSNLEWCTQKYNLTYGTVVDRRSRTQSHAILMIDGNGVQAEFPSLRIASQKTGIREGNISSACHGKREHAGGYMWAYKDAYRYKPKEAQDER